MTITTEDQLRRESMSNFIRRVGWSFTLKDTATQRWGQEVAVRIAEKGTFKGLPVKGWTNTETGTIFMREEIFDGIDLTEPANRAAVQITIEALVNGTPINKYMIYRGVEYNVYLRSDEQRDTVWRIAQTVAAAYGVFGHEYGHAAYSEHAMRDSYQMGLEDLREESLWMAADPIRARQGLRACAGHWVLHDTSPMAGAQEFDLSKVTSHASLLHLYLLIVGRGRIGVLDDQSKLVVGVRDLAEQVFGWELLSDANDIIDRFIETAEDPNDPQGATDRATLAKEFSELLPKEAGKPKPGIGCHPNPSQEPETESAKGDSDDSDDSDAGPGQPGSQSDDESDGAGEGEDEGEGQSDESDGKGKGKGKDQSDEGGSQSGDEESEDTGDGTGDAGDDAGDADDDADQSGSGDDGDTSSEDGDDEGEGTGKGRSEGQSEDDEDDEDGEDGDDGLIIGTDRGGDSDGDSDGEGGQDKDADFVTGSFGHDIRPGEEATTDELDESGAYSLTEEEVKALTDILVDGLEEISNSEDGAGWAISDAEGVLLKSRSEAPTKVASEVFSRKALIARNRRLRAAVT